jgi:hypothetical protein
VSLAGAVTLAACAAEAPTAARIIYRDSAGVSLVESWTPKHGQDFVWRIAEAPVLDLATSGAGAPNEFYSVADATRLSDGSIAVADGGSNQVRVFSRSGTFLYSAGREGDGPGEYRRLASVEEVVGDSLVVFDRSAKRLTILDSKRTVGRIVSLRRESNWINRPHAAGAGHFLALLSISDWPDEEGPWRALYDVVRLSPTGAVLETLEQLPGHSGFRLTLNDGSPADGHPLIQTGGYLDVSPAGAVVGSGDEMSFRRYTVMGDLDYIARVPSYDVRLTESMIQAERNAMLTLMSERMRDYIAELPAPERRPAYSDLKLDPDGFVWAAEYRGLQGAGEPTAWLVFSPQGEWLGSVSTPARFEVYEIGKEYVLGLLRDNFDVEHVQVLALSR